MIKHKLYEGGLSPIEARIQSLLVGAFCFGDDGEDAEVISFWVDRNRIPMIEIRQDDGIEYTFPLAEYLGSIELEQDEMEEIEDYLDSLGLYESAKPAKRKLVLNEGVKGKVNLHIILDSEDSASSINFVKWARELLKEVGMPVPDFVMPTRTEKVFVKEGNIYYQSPFIEGFKAVKAKMLQARLQKYANKAEFPVGMTIIADRGMFTAPFDISGEIKIANI